MTGHFTSIVPRPHVCSTPWAILSWLNGYGPGTRWTCDECYTKWVLVRNAGGPSTWHKEGTDVARIVELAEAARAAADAEREHTLAQLSDLLGVEIKTNLRGAIELTADQVELLTLQTRARIAWTGTADTFASIPIIEKPIATLDEVRRRHPEGIDGDIAASLEWQNLMIDQATTRALLRIHKMGAEQ